MSEMSNCEDALLISGDYAKPPSQRCVIKDSDARRRGIIALLDIVS